jgi:hypothetical protein
MPDSIELRVIQVPQSIAFLLMKARRVSTRTSKVESHRWNLQRLLVKISCRHRSRSFHGGCSPNAVMLYDSYHKNEVYDPLLHTMQK